MKFSEWYCLIVTLLGVAFLFCFAFVTIPEANQRYADTILGFVIGTMLTAAIQWAIGSSKSSQDKTALIKGPSQ